ncbi:hypothetical protein GCM10012280_28610 [Wenjunlia tyrosinilytica]|uniref:Uncharacterized protein n=1 Tax=Wenjunlia tyrosinilytica TaxID=1544741 RepID=A0A918DXA9_9ACTN|nr:hypothetical protein GCM10012280_28610 [Wenjunlia tyrosinilytica]
MGGAREASHKPLDTCCYTPRPGSDRGVRRVPHPPAEQRRWPCGGYFPAALRIACAGLEAASITAARPARGPRRAGSRHSDGNFM